MMIYFKSYCHDENQMQYILQASNKNGMTEIYTLIAGKYGNISYHQKFLPVVNLSYEIIQNIQIGLCPAIYLKMLLLVRNP